MLKRIRIAAIVGILCLLLPTMLFSQEADSTETDAETESEESTTETESEGKASLGWGNAEKDSGSSGSGEDGDSGEASGESDSDFVLSWEGDEKQEAGQTVSPGFGLLGGMTKEKQEEPAEEDMTRDVEQAYFKKTSFYLDTMAGGGGILGAGLSYYYIPATLEFKLTSMISLAPYFDEDGDGSFMPAFTLLLKSNYYLFSDKFHSPYAGGGIAYTNTFEDALSAVAFGVSVGYEGRFPKLGSIYGELNFYVDTKGYTSFNPAVGWKFFW